MVIVCQENRLSVVHRLGCDTELQRGGGSPAVLFQWRWSQFVRNAGHSVLGAGWMDWEEEQASPSPSPHPSLLLRSGHRAPSLFLHLTTVLWCLHAITTSMYRQHSRNPPTRRLTDQQACGPFRRHILPLIPPVMFSLGLSVML